MYALALEEGLTGEILKEMKVIRTLFQENPDYVHLLSEPSIPGNERIDLIEAAFGNQAERYLVNFLKLLCERNLLREFGGCCDEYARRYNRDNGIADVRCFHGSLLNYSGRSKQQATGLRAASVGAKRVPLGLSTPRITCVLAALQLLSEVNGRSAHSKMKIYPIANKFA